jgi:hypothetical protein
MNSTAGLDLVSAITPPNPLSFAPAGLSADWGHLASGFNYNCSKVSILFEENNFSSWRLRPSKMAQAGTLGTCIREVLGLNLARGTEYFD